MTVPRYVVSRFVPCLLCFAGGDPYLPCIYCTACAEKSNTESESGTDSCERSEQMTE